MFVFCSKPIPTPATESTANPETDYSMSPSPLNRFRRLRWVAILALAASTQAFPPAPHHVIFGLVRDQIGNPLTSATAQVTLTANSGTSLTDLVVPNMEPGANYRLQVPMDSGLTSDLYQASALLPAVPFKLSVKVGSVTYVPMEMTGDYAVLGQPGEVTRIDLTLGVDSDNDGLPDAWEQAAFRQLGKTWKAGALDPNAMYPGTGLTFAQVYVAGTYNYSPKDGFVLNLTGVVNGKAQLAFTAVKGRSYTIESAANLGSFAPVNFRLTSDDPNVGLRSYFQATGTAKQSIEVPLDATGTPARFYRLRVE